MSEDRMDEMLSAEKRLLGRGQLSSWLEKTAVDAESDARLTSSSK